MTGPTPGLPTWVDLGTADVADAQRFYTALFDWTAHVSGDDYGGYTIFNLDGRPAAGAGPLFGDGQPTAWSTYFATADVDASAQLVEAAGGKVLVPPFDVMEQGRMAACLDHLGAPFSLWQAGTMAGSEVLDVPGAWTWSELATRDLDGSAAFYGRVFGWTARASEAYVLWDLDGRAIGGMQSMDDDRWPADMAPHWMPYFGVRDCAEAAALSGSLGGRVVRPPTRFALGTYAVLADPQDGTFSVLEPIRS